MVIGLTTGLDACSACSSSPGGRTNCFSYFIVLSHKLTYASSDGGSLGGEIHLVNHRNPKQSTLYKVYIHSNSVYSMRYSILRKLATTIIHLAS